MPDRIDVSVGRGKFGIAETILGERTEDRRDMAAADIAVTGRFDIRNQVRGKQLPADETMSPSLSRGVSPGTAPGSKPSLTALRQRRWWGSFVGMGSSGPPAHVRDQLAVDIVRVREILDRRTEVRQPEAVRR